MSSLERSIGSIRMYCFSFPYVGNFAASFFSLSVFLINGPSIFFLAHQFCWSFRITNFDFVDLSV